MKKFLSLPLCLGILLCIPHPTFAESGDVIEPIEIDLEKPLSESVPSELLYLYWNMNESSGVEVANQAATGPDYNGLLYPGGFSAPEFGPSRSQEFGNAVWLQGEEKLDANTDANPHIKWSGEGHLDALNLTQTSFTAGLWVKFNALTGAGERIRLINRGRTAVQDYWDYTLSRVQSNNRYIWVLDFSIGTQRGTSERVRAILPADILPDLWYHFAFSLEYKENEGSEIRFFLNGELLNTEMLPLTISPPTSLDQQLTVGERATSSYHSRLNAWIDEVFIARGLHDFTPATPY